MYSFNTITRGAAISALTLLLLATGCSKSAETPTTGVSPSATAVVSANTASKLGDLSAFRSIAADVAAIVDKGDFPAARTRIKDLEVAWDSAEAGLKPRAADDWHILDKAIDHALREVRADTPHQADCNTAMVSLLRSFDSLQSKGPSA